MRIVVSFPGLRSNFCRSKSCNLKSAYDIILGQTNVFRLLSVINMDLGLLSSRRCNLMIAYDITRGQTNVIRLYISASRCLSMTRCIDPIAI